MMMTRGGEEEEAEAHQALTTCQSLLQAFVRIHSFSLTTGP